MTQQNRIPLEEKDISILSPDDEILKSITGTFDLVTQKGLTVDEAEQLKQQILDDAKKAELYDTTNEFLKENSIDYMIKLQRENKKNSKIVDEIRKAIIPWHYISGGKRHGTVKLVDEIESLLKENEK